MQYLFTQARRYVSPHRLIEGALPFLRELIELLDGLGVLTGDDRWREAWEKFRRAREALLEPSELQRKLIERAREVAHVDEMLREIHRYPELVERIRAQRKPMARVVLREPKLLAAKVARRVRSSR